MMGADGGKGEPSLLFISSDKYPPFRVDVRILFAKELASRGYRIDWILQSEQPCTADHVESWGGGRAWVARTDPGAGRMNRLRKHLYSLRNDLRMFGLARRNRYDIIQVKDKFIAALFGLVAARLAGARFTYWLSYPFPEESLFVAKEGSARYPVFYRIRGIVFKFLLYRIIMPLADHVFVQSEQMKRDVHAMGIPVEKMTAVPMGVELAAIPYRPDAASTGGSAPKKVVYLGTLIKVRRLDFLIRVFALVRQRHEAVQLVMVGDGDDPADRQLLELEANRLGVRDAVIFTGFLPMAEAWRYVASADVCVSPFFPTPILNSTSPTKLIEYMAMAKPVVANDHPEQNLVLSESGGGYCVAWDENSFAQAIIALLENPDRAREMGKAGRRYVEQHRDYGKIADCVAAEYRRISGQRSPVAQCHGREE